LSLEVDFYLREIPRIEVHFNGFPGQMGRNFVEVGMQHERGIAAHAAIQAVEEQATQIRVGTKLPHALDIPLPACQGSGGQAGMLGAVIHLLDPGPQPLVQLLQREPGLGIQIGQELLSDGKNLSIFPRPSG